MHHLTFGINSLLHSVNFIVFILLLAHLILRISPHHRNQEDSEHNEVDGMKKGADSTGKVMHV